MPYSSPASFVVGVSAAVAIALGAPLSYLYVQHERLATETAGNAQYKAQALTELATTRPATWMFEERKIQGMLERRLAAGQTEFSYLADRDGTVMARAGDRQPRPWVTSTSTVYDAGRPVGRLYVSRSLREAVVNSSFLLLLGALLGGTSYFFLRVKPLRALREAYGELQSAHDAFFHEKERAQVTLASIGDAVITTGVHRHIEYMNPMAEHMIGIRSAQAQGRLLDEVFIIVNETSRLPVQSPVTLCLEQDRIIELANHTVLIGQQGQEFSIEDSAAPIRDRAGKTIGAVVVFHDVTERKMAEKKLDCLAYHDSLTGLPNRNLFRDRVRHAIGHAKRNHLLVSVLFLDLDRFKEVNDTLGHDVGDELLLEVASRLQQCIRASDTVARLGGDEFTVVLEGGLAPETAGIVAQKIINGMKEPFRIRSHDLFVATSIGISHYPHDGDTIEEVIRSADTAMYSAKQMGGNTYQYYTASMNEAAMERMQLQNALRHALERNEFELHFQPKSRLADNRVVGMEALLRWNSPELGAIGPARFIPLLEESGQIVEVGNWVLREAAVRTRAWNDAADLPLRVSVNVSPRQFQQPDLARTVFRILEETGLAPGHLELEITESMLVNQEMAKRHLTAIKARGITIALDDFGTGYSSLSYLQQYPIDVLKIDKSFVQNLDEAAGNKTLVKTIIAMAHSLDIRATAEGVETAGQLAFLKSLGCDDIQGYWLAWPMPADAFHAWLEARQSSMRR